MWHAPAVGAVACWSMFGLRSVSRMCGESPRDRAAVLSESDTNCTSVPRATLPTDTHVWFDPPTQQSWYASFHAHAGSAAGKTPHRCASFHFVRPAHFASVESTQQYRDRELTL
jgi:hypothetical protein